MQAEVVKTENGISLLLPEEALAFLKLGDDKAVDVSIRAGRVAISNPANPSPTAEELVAKITDENIHTAVD